MIRDLTGDDRTDTLVPLAVQLSAAVHDHDRNQITNLLDGADLEGLAVVLAAMVPDDLSPRELLAWLGHPDEYRRLRVAGVGPYTANAVIHGSRQAQESAA